MEECYVQLVEERGVDSIRVISSKYNLKLVREAKIECMSGGHRVGLSGKVRSGGLESNAKYLEPS